MPEDLHGKERTEALNSYNRHCLARRLRVQVAGKTGSIVLAMLILLGVNLLCRVPWRLAAGRVDFVVSFTVVFVVNPVLSILTGILCARRSRLLGGLLAASVVVAVSFVGTTFWAVQRWGPGVAWHFLRGGLRYVTAPASVLYFLILALLGIGAGFLAEHLAAKKARNKPELGGDK